MPELPEVENVKRGLERHIQFAVPIQSAKVSNKKLRLPLPRDLNQKLAKQYITKIERRAKYIIFYTHKCAIISHLGMTGSWRFERQYNKIKHDHIVIEFADGNKMIYNDPRRFGIFQVTSREKLINNVWLKNLGLEPFDQEFNAPALKKLASDKKMKIRSFLMNQKYIVGVGNIYVAEILFLAKILPTRKTFKLSLNDWKNIVHFTQNILKNAIEHGGTTLRNYRKVDGSSGEFKNELYVYGLAGDQCKVCSEVILSEKDLGRTSFWCPKCQI